ncbi:hypothetical protein SAY86_022065 [Trapa natans]|uniref:Uncharacterized protein n=1 Tax=Trapa natans TaxID=22666 RepID=A0AAN7N055_TRANT|nr:hypothetical protein SAY86_022065 [Trapa natans]
MKLAYLPDRRGKNEIGDGGNYASGPSFGRMDEKSYLADLVKDFKRNRRHEMFGWFKVIKPGNLLRVPKISDGESSSNGLPASCSMLCHDEASSMNEGRKRSVSQSGVVSSMVDSSPERTQAGELFGAAFKGCHVSSTDDTIIDQVDLLREQVKMGTNNPNDLKLKVQIQNLKDDINEKKHHMQVLEQLMIESLGMTSRASKMVEINEALSKLTTQINERSFPLEMSENDEMQETIILLRQQLAENKFSLPKYGSHQSEGSGACEGTNAEETTPTSLMSSNRVFLLEDSRKCNGDATLNSLVLTQAAEIDSLKQEQVSLREQKDGLEIQVKKLTEEALYAKEVTNAAALELQDLAKEVTKLSYENSRLKGDLAEARGTSTSTTNNPKLHFGFKR